MVSTFVRFFVLLLKNIVCFEVNKVVEKSAMNSTYKDENDNLETT